MLKVAMARRGSSQTVFPRHTSNRHHHISAAFLALEKWGMCGSKYCLHAPLLCASSYTRRCTYRTFVMLRVISFAAVLGVTRGFVTPNVVRSMSNPTPEVSSGILCEGSRINVSYDMYHMI